MKQEFGKIESNLTLKDGLALFGMCTGNIRVENGGVLHLYGMCTGNIEVFPGGTVELLGMCTGNVLNSGGKLMIVGTINGNLQRISGETNIDPKASIGRSN